MINAADSVRRVYHFLKAAINRFIAEWELQSVLVHAGSEQG
jgi:hypothetical protein